MDSQNLQERLHSVETAVDGLRTLEPTLQFLHSNIQFFRNLVTELDRRMVLLENAINTGLPAQIIAENAKTQERMSAHVETIAQATVRSEVKTLRTNLDELRRSVPTLYATKEEVSYAIQANTTTEAKKESSSKKKIPTPEAFSGKREDWKTFSNRLALYFTATGSDYPTDSDKIVFAVSRLGDTSAFRYMETYLEEFSLPTADPDRSLMTTDYKHFLGTMRKTFGVQNAEVVAGAQLRNLRQKGSAMDYTTKFREIASDLSFNDAALIDQYRLGLKDEVIDTIEDQDNVPTTFEEYAALAITVDNRKYARSLDKKNRNTTPAATRTPALKATPDVRPTPQRAPATSNGPTPMDLGQVKHISAEEKARRRAEGSCLYCGNPGHFADKCPAKRRTQLAAVETEDQDADEITITLEKD